MKREKSPGFLLSMSMSARGVRRAPSRMTMDPFLPMVSPPLYSFMKAAGTRGPLTMKFVIPML